MLVNNAIEFTPTGRIEVALDHDSVSRTHDRLPISVTDTGIGIAPRRHGRLLQRFSRVDGSSSRRRGGTGLGLAVSRRLPNSWEAPSASRANRDGDPPSGSV
jgi:signal transduction histidine kinase